MEENYDKQGQTQVRKGHEGREPEGKPGVVGTISCFSGKLGDNEIGASRKNSEQSNSAVRGEQSIDGILGEVANQLIVETEKQLAYYQEQVESLQSRLKELKGVSGICVDTDDYD